MKLATLLRPSAVVHELHSRTDSALDRIDQALDKATAVADRLQERENKQ